MLRGMDGVKKAWVDLVVPINLMYIQVPGTLTDTILNAIMLF